MERTPSTYAYSNAVTWPWGECREAGHRDAVGNNPDQHIWLRILGTTDVHGHVLPYDYANDAPVETFGFAKVAKHIEVARREAQNTLLFDNGDYLQGSPLTDIGTRPENGWTGANPVITIMNHVAYDAATLGNHEFNFGLDWLTSTLGEARFPVVCANAVLKPHPRDPCQDETLVQPFVVLKRDLQDSEGQMHTIKIGVIGLLPPQIMEWDREWLTGRIVARDIIETALAYIPKMRAAGADIIVALAHTGIGNGDTRPGQENVGLALANVPGIDAILTGHTHQVFPDPHKTSTDQSIRFDTGTLADVPSVMAGFRGSHLGIIDLKLVPHGSGWKIKTHQAQAKPVCKTGIKPDSDIANLAKPAHKATLRHISDEIGHSGTPIHSFLSQVRPDPGQHLIMASKRDALEAALADTEFAHLPVLSASAPYKTGGSGGPDYYTNIPAGPLSIRSIADLYPFPNTLVGLHIRASQIAEWLERSVSCFHQIKPGRARQPLWNPDFVGHSFDTVSGLSYAIDLTEPARYRPDGTLANPKARRIKGLSHQNKHVSQSDEFVIALKSFRAFSSGFFDNPGPVTLLYQGRKPIRDILADYIRENGCPGMAQAQSPWAFLPVENASVTLDTGPGVLGHPSDLAALSATVLDRTHKGFVRLELPV